MENTGLNGTKRKIPFFTCRWLVGFALLVVGSILHVAALPFASLVVLSTGTATSIIFNNLLAVFYLGEIFNWKVDSIAYTLIIAANSKNVCCKYAYYRRMSGNNLSYA